MPITPEHVGRSYPTSEPYLVGPAKIAEFAAALHDENSAYAGEEAMAPPTFAFVIATRAWQALFDDTELDLALHRILHTDQQFTWHRPLRTGDRVVATLSIEKVRQRGPADMIGTLVELATVEGEPVASCRATLLHSREEAGE